MVPEVALHLPQALCTVTSEEGQVRVTRLPSCPPEVPAGSAALPALLKRFGRLRVQPVRWGGGPGQLIESSEAGITIQGRPATIQDVLGLIRVMSSGQRCVLTAEPATKREATRARAAAAAEPQQTVRAYIGRAHGEAAILQEESLTHGVWSDEPATAPTLPATVAKQLEETFSATEARFTFLSVDLVINQDGTWTITDLSTEPAYPVRGFDEAARAFLAKRLRKQRSRRKQAAAFDESQTPTQAERRMIQRHGFSLDTIRRFGVDADNAHKFVSEHDFLRAQPFNQAAAGRSLRRQVMDGRQGRWNVLDQALYLFERDLTGEQGSAGEQVRITALSDSGRRHKADLDEVLSTVAQTGEALLGSDAWDATPAWRISIPAQDTEQPGRAVTVNGIDYSKDEFHALLTAVTRDRAQVLTVAGVSDEARPGRFSTQGSVQIRVSMLNETDTEPQVADAFVVGHHARSTRKTFRSEGQLVGSEQPHLPSAALLDTLHESLQADIAAGESAGLDLWPEGLRDLSGVDLVARISPRTGRVETARAMVGTELYEYTRHPVTFAPLHGVVPGWDALVEDLKRICRSAPGLRFVEFTAVITTHGHRILGCSLLPSYPTCYTFSVPVVDFIRSQVRAKRFVGMRDRARSALAAVLPAQGSGQRHARRGVGHGDHGADGAVPTYA
jgi:hypothetical protein